nr:unnamed protein product [Spirometra erinaceieuropaei]
MLMTKTIPDADGWTDHRLVISEVRIHLQSRRRPPVSAARLPQLETNVDLDLLPSLHETIKSVQQVSSGKAPGSDAIPAEIYKHGDPQLMDHLTALFQEMWRQ